MNHSDTRQDAGHVQLIVADLAGTTIDYGSRAPAGAFIDLFSRYGVTATVAHARAPMGMHKRDHIREMLKIPALGDQWRTATGTDWTEEDVERLFVAFQPLQLEALPRYTDAIPGAVETLTAFQRRGLRVAATTGYNREMTDVVLEAAATQGYTPDVSVCAAEVAAGRPAPWMIYRCMEAVGVYPPTAVVNVGDTISDVQSGRNAGCWSVGVAKTGNMLGLSLEEVEALSEHELTKRVAGARDALAEAGAHYVIDSIEELGSVIDLIR